MGLYLINIFNIRLNWFRFCEKYFFSVQILAEDRIHHDYEVKGTEEVKGLEQAKEKLKQVDDQLKLKELERTEKEKISTALEAAIKDKKEELEEVVRRAECLGEEVAPGEVEAQQV